VLANLEIKSAQLEGSAFQHRVVDAMCDLFESLICTGYGQKGCMLLAGVCAYCDKHMELTVGVNESHMAKLEAGEQARK
jgi:hypothetical protein